MEQNVPFSSIESGYSKESLVQHLTDYRNFNPDEPAVALEATDLSVCERLPRGQVTPNQQTESVSSVLGFRHVPMGIIAYIVSAFLL